MDTKPDAPQIREFLTELLNANWLKDTEQRLWPRYAFHYTDIRNVVDILNQGRLLSRQRMEEANKLAVSSGSDEILALTDWWVKDCLRLYFRPKTPTQYYAEGVKSKLALEHSRFPDAHCPAPVFLLFDLAQILCLADSKFSDKGLGSHRYHIYFTADQLRALNWSRIYHNGVVDTNTREGREITACRNAEIIVPHELDLSALKFIYCRSQAEMDSLVHMLLPDVLNNYRSRTYSSARQNLFNRQHTFLETVRLSSDSVTLHFSPDTASPGPFELTIVFKTVAGAMIEERKIKDFIVRNQSGKYNWCIPTPAKAYEITIMLDGALVYSNSYLHMETPF